MFSFAVPQVHSTFKEPSTYIMEGITNLHNDILEFLFFISLIVIIIVLILYSRFTIKGYLYQLVKSIKGLNSKIILFDLKQRANFTKITDGILIEILWTILPCFVLLYIAIPSFILLYASSEYLEPQIILKIIGHQWYWNFEYTHLEIIHTDSFKYILDSLTNLIDTNLTQHSVYDSYMRLEDNLNIGDLRLLETNTPIVLPTDTALTAIVTSMDVIHSWAIPNLGIKIDAVPGRLNQISFLINNTGVFYGQCSEICGVNHGFMPISVYAVEPDVFNSYFNLMHDADKQEIKFYSIKDPFAIGMSGIYEFQDMLVDLDIGWSDFGMFNLIWCLFIQPILFSIITAACILPSFDSITNLINNLI
jgi:cytochrome c oxidase subunit 2